MSDFIKYKKRLLILFFTLIILPINVLAYSKYLIPGGENLGINIKSNGILIVGFYDANVKSDLQIGDIIVSINDTSISSIDEMLEALGSVGSGTVTAITELPNVTNNITTNKTILKTFILFFSNIVQFYDALRIYSFHSLYFIILKNYYKIYN